MALGGRQWKSWVIIVALVLGPFAVWHATQRSTDSSVARVIRRWALPVQYVVGLGMASMFRVQERLARWKEHEAQIDAIQLELRLLREENRKLRVSAAQKSRILNLEKALELSTPREFALGRVVEKRSSELMRQCTIRVLQLEDLELRPGLAVLAAEGLVGWVTGVHGDLLDVQLISDPRSAIDVVLAESREPALLSGSQSLEHVLRIGMLRAGAAAAPGDWMLTSALGGRFPPDLPVARIRDLESPRGELFRTGIATPAADLDTLEEVLIVGSGTP